MLSLIVAVSDNNAIGLRNSLPWGHIHRDMRWFRENTANKVVVMGSSTWASLPMHPLPKRVNVVLSSNDIAIEQGADVVLRGTTQEIIDRLTSDYGDQEICIMGGAKVYQDFAPFVDRVYLTRIHGVFDGDTFLDIDTVMAVSGKFDLTFREGIIEPQRVTFQIWDKVK